MFTLAVVLSVLICVLQPEMPLNECAKSRQKLVLNALRIQQGSGFCYEKSHDTIVRGALEIF
jgi:hypothetical protein